MGPNIKEDRPSQDIDAGTGAAEAEGAICDQGKVLGKQASMLQHAVELQAKGAADMTGGLRSIPEL